MKQTMLVGLVTLFIYIFEKGNNETKNIGWFGCSKKEPNLKF